MTLAPISLIQFLILRNNSVQQIFLSIFVFYEHFAEILHKIPLYKYLLLKYYNNALMFNKKELFTWLAGFDA